MTYDAIVIGAGANGLVAATMLAKAGRRVLAVERSEAAGGSARPIEFAPGFRAALPALDPGWFPRPVARALGLRALARPVKAPLTFAVEDDLVSLVGDPNADAATIARYSKNDATAWPAFVAHLRKLAGFLERVYLRPVPEQVLRSPAELIRLAGLALAFRRLGRADMAALMRALPMSAQDFLDDWLEWEPLKAALAAGGVQQIRQGPRSNGTAFVLLHHLAGAPAGVVRRAGHRANVVATMEAAARRAGVLIRTDADVRRIAVKNDAVAAVVLADGEEIAAPIVLSSADPRRTIGLVDPVWLDPEFLHAIQHIKYRGCTAYVLYALDRLPEWKRARDGTDVFTGLTCLTSSMTALERAYDGAKYGRVSEAPHVEFTIPTLASPEDAPDGKHVLIARAQYAPYELRDAAWDRSRRDAFADAVTATIARTFPGFAEQVRHRALLAPPDLEARFGSTEGALYQGEMMLDQILFMRPVPGWARYRMPVNGLYLCGAGTHPGGGIIGASGYHAARQVLRDGKRAAKDKNA